MNKKTSGAVIAIFLAVIVIFTVAITSGSDETGATTTPLPYTSTTEEASSATEVTTTEPPSETEKETEAPTTKPTTQNITSSSKVNSKNIPDYSGKVFIHLNSSIPSFSKNELTAKGYESYSPLDSLGRCGVAKASLGKELMPKESEKRGSISDVYPSGWVQAKYDFISGKYLYNRCHLIGWQLSAENANRRNLITGTRYFNVKGMLPFENMVADYINETGNHVAYRVTPYYEGDDLVAKGVQIEAYSVEDEGDGICFNVFCYNVQPDIEINYATGGSKATVSISTTRKSTTTTKKTTSAQQPVVEARYICNTNTKKFHEPDCRHVKKMKNSNKMEYNGSRDRLINQGYSPCGTCKP